MTNLIRERNVYQTANVKTLQELLAPKNEAPAENQEDKESSLNKVASNTKKVVLPLSLIAGGGILLYYGIKMPSQLAQFKLGIRNKKFEMNTELGRLGVITWDVLDKSFTNAGKYIQKYIEKYCLKPEDYLVNFRTVKEPRKILMCKNMALNAVRRSDNYSYSGGANDFDTFDRLLQKEKASIEGILDRKRQRSKQFLKDLAHVPEFSDGKYSEHVNMAREELNILADVLSGQVDQVGNSRLEFLLKANYNKMRDAIVDSRHLRMKTKTAIIDTSFDKIRRALDLPEDFVPSYNKIPDGSKIKSLTHDELKPQKLPQELIQSYQDNPYFNVLQTTNFSKLSTEELHDIFFSAPYEMSLKDLSFLIDEMRLEEVVARSEKSQYVDSFRIIIAKLEHLLVKLNDYGEKELVSRASKDFDNISVEKRRANLAYVSAVARRLGYATVEEMDKCLAKSNSEYAKLDIRKYMDIFEETPEFYFF